MRVLIDLLEQQRKQVELDMEKLDEIGAELAVHGLIACEECFNTLTDEERYFYGGRCEGCKVLWSDRISAWRPGGPDEEMDRMFAAPSALA